MEVLDRFMDKVSPEPNSGCWLWAGATRDGYGQFWLNGQMRNAHRVSYEIFTGPISDDLELDHLCRVRPCVNPAHLEQVTHKENVRRGVAGEAFGAMMRAKTHCPKGHPYSGNNLYVNPGGHRFCRKCKRLSDKKSREQIRLRNQNAKQM